MSYQYPLQSIRQPRSYIFSSNIDALTLNSVFPETRMSFFNSTSADTPNFMISASNQYFNILKNETVISTFNLVNSVPDFSVYGNVRTSNLYVTSPQPKKAIILADYVNSFAGFGYDGTTLNYQVPSRSGVHAFYASADQSSSVEWMRIQESLLHTPQVGIGTATFSNSEMLRVAGDTIIDGKLTVSRGINISSLPSNIVSSDQFGRLTSNQLPNSVVFTDPNTNLIPSSVLPTTFPFNTVVSNKNVGIGTRIALQKLHIQGSLFTTDRIGVGTSVPSARIHCLENTGSIPTAILDNVSGGDILYGKINGQTKYVFSGSHAGIGIGTTAVPLSSALYVYGDSTITGNVTANSVNTSNVNCTGINIQNSNNVLLRNETVSPNTPILSSYTPVMFNAGLSVNTIQPLQNSAFVQISNGSLVVSNDIYTRGNLVSVSDVRLKDDVQVIDKPLERLDYLHGYTYTRKDVPDTSKRYAGIIAQEVMNSLPEAASSLPGDDTYIGVQYSSIIPLLIESIHALKDKISVLESKIK